MSPDDEQRRPGTLEKADEDGTFTGGGPESDDVVRQAVQRVSASTDYRVGDGVQAGFLDSERFPVSELAVGQKYRGTVRNIHGFGAFVDIGAESDGLVHISKINGEQIEDIHDFVEVGEDVDVWVSEVRDDDRYALTMVEGLYSTRRGADRNSAVAGIADLAPDAWLDGEVVSIAPFGAFVAVALPDGSSTAEGMVHISNIRDDFVDSVRDELQVGQEVKVRVLASNKENGRLDLTMRERPVSVGASAFLGCNGWLTGKVASLLPYGAFVTVNTPDGAASVDGLVHITEIRDSYVERVEDELQVGDEVQVRVLTVDALGEKLRLSMKG